ncbi:growth factor receptor-bound protein 10-like isoform X2 [Hypomesus transpacificus]|uniref:growth factor receptor-bound protein 10-like isoform X2 n=1 Tax=Hypomesus transpacificus TaxID=137520 RepID=UPI001F085DE8|nr:growth factor receptor-bound protein 10-like isoform X2 [Hypomesus transpacificus]
MDPRSSQSGSCIRTVITQMEFSLNCTFIQASLSKLNVTKTERDRRIQIMAVAGCPDYFLHHPNYQDKVDQTTNHNPAELIGPSFQPSTNHKPADLIGPRFQPSNNRNSPNHQDDDVDLEALVNDMNSSFESLYTTCSLLTDSTPLLQNGQSQRPAATTEACTLQSVSPKQNLRRSQPMHILAFRRLQEEEEQLRTSSLPAIPNPFPELCSPASSPVLSPGSLPPCPPSSGKHVTRYCVFQVIRYCVFQVIRYCVFQVIRISSEDGMGKAYCVFQVIRYCVFQVIRISSEDGMGKALEIPVDMTARDLCQLLVYRSHCVDDNSWTLVEHHPLQGLERCLEDHELVVHVQASMSGDGGRLLFRKNYAKYEFFRNPLTFFPESMVAWCQESNGTIPPSQLLQNLLAPNSCPEIQGFLFVKELSRKSWKKLYVFLRRSGLYISTKGVSKEPRHLQLLADLEDNNLFTVTAGRKLHCAPTDYQFCIKPSKGGCEGRELRILCAEDEQSRTSWMTAFRLFKYGIVLYQNYKIPQQRKNLLFTGPMRSVSENSLVAMDFSGRIGRVIENPVEAQSAALEEAHAWRKKSQRLNTANPSPLHHSSLSSVIHSTQLWFHGRITREESHRMVYQQGQVDGLFLLRVSQSNPKAFVLTLCHHQKIKHFQILTCEEEGQVFFSLDDAATKFTDLIQLVEFYQLNRGVLPCKLKHPCTLVAL